jgi:DNA-binding transcriptional LysR family regulator
MAETPTIERDARIAVSVPHSWCLPPILVGSDMIASIPRVLATEFVRRFGLAIVRDTGGSDRITVEAIWDRQQETDPAMVWLRAEISAAAAAGA